MANNKNSNVDDDEKQPHAILVAYPLQGHIIPSVHLAIKLASRGFTITYVNTHSVHKQTSKAQPHRSDDDDQDIFAHVRKSEGLDIRYATVSDGLPVDFDRSLNHDQFMASLVHVFSAHAEEVVGKIVRSPNTVPPVTCLIADTFFVWPSKVAKKFGLFCVSFWTEPALVFTLYYHLHLLRRNGHFACPNVRRDAIDYIPGVKSIHPKDMTSYLQDSDTSSIVHQLIFGAFHDVRGADFILCNTVQDLEPLTISALQNHLPFYPIGPISPIGLTERRLVATSLWSESDCAQWLGAKPHGSVLYISFGSYAHLAHNDLLEIAHGLSKSGVSFVWVLRPDIVSSADTDPLPVGFREEISDRSIVVPWCRQIEVLAHPAIGGFLTHCGWNSVLESVWCGVPMLCFPLLTDQFTNRKLVVEDWKVGINLTGGPSVKAVDVSENVNRLMFGKTGSDCRKASQVVRTILDDSSSRPDGSSRRNLHRFIEDLKNKTRAKHANDPHP